METHTHAELNTKFGDYGRTFAVNDREKAEAFRVESKVLIPVVRLVNHWDKDVTKALRGLPTIREGAVPHTVGWLVSLVGGSYAKPVRKSNY